MSNKLKERNFNVVRIDQYLQNKNNKPVLDLNNKQFLVYGYLLTRTCFNTSDIDHYYIRVWELPSVASLCRNLHIAKQTYYSTIKKLKEQKLLEEVRSIDTNSKNKESELTYYKMRWNKEFVPMDIDTLKTLVGFGSALTAHGGLIMSVFAAIYYYKENRKSKPTGITINTLCQMFYGGHTGVSKRYTIQLFLLIYKYMGLVDFHIEQKEYYGKKYGYIVIDNVSNEMSIDPIADDVFDKDAYDGIIEALNNSRDIFEEKKKSKRSYDSIIEALNNSRDIFEVGKNK